MQRTSLGFLLVLNAVLLAGIYLAAGPTPQAQAQFANGGARYTMIGARAEGRGDEATIFIIDTQTGATVPIEYVDGRDRFRLSAGRSIVEDAAALADEQAVPRRGGRN